MRVFFVPMHVRRARSIAIMLQASGIDVFTPSDGWVHDIRGRHRNSFAYDIPGAVQLTEKQFKKNPMDLLMLKCYEQENGNWWQRVAAHQPDVPVIHYAGNNNVPYNPKRLHNLVATDPKLIKVLTDRVKEKTGRDLNSLHFRPVLPYHDWPDLMYRREHMIEPYVGSYVIGLEQHWPKARRQWKTMAELMFSSPLALRNYENLTAQGVANIMAHSVCTVHFKDREGYGSVAIESAAMGVPVIITKELGSNNPIGDHIIPEHQVDGPKEAFELASHWWEDREALAEAGISAATHIRHVIDEVREIDKFTDFIYGVIENAQA